MTDLNTRLEVEARAESGALVARGWPWAAVCAALALAGGLGLAISGIYVLAGSGWALLASSVPLLLLGTIIIRGLLRG